MQKAVPIFAIIFATLLALLSFSGCNPVGKKIGMAEKAFDRGDYETAQFEYFELLSSTSGDVQEKAAQSLFNRAAELVSSSSFDPHDYFEWAALFDTLPEYKAKLDAGFAKSITARAQALLDSGETTESAILIGYLPDGQDDNGLGVRIARSVAKIIAKIGTAFCIKNLHYLSDRLFDSDCSKRFIAYERFVSAT